MRRHLLALALLQCVSARLGEPTAAAYSYSFTEPPSAAPTTETGAPTRTESYAPTRVNDGNGFNSGHTRVFEYNGTDWAQLGGDVDGEAAGDRSGRSVALSADGTRLAVGAYVNSGVNGDSSGHARVYDVCSTNEPTPTPTRATTTST